jgi:hypothetical protein
MKFFNICAVLAVFVASASSTLLQDFQELRQIFPWEEFKVIVSDYVQNDTMTMAAVAQLRSDDFEVFYTQFTATTEFKTFLNYLEGSGIKAVKTFNLVASYLGLPAFIPKKFKCESNKKLIIHFEHSF